MGDFTPSTKLALEQLTKIVSLFSSKELPKVAAMRFIDAPEKPSSNWSLGNHLLMYLAETEDARTYNQWGEVVRYPRKGTKAFYILGPTIINAKVKRIDDDGEHEVEEPRLIGFHAIAVFRFEDTDGKLLPEYKPKTLPPLMNVAQSWNVKIKYDLLGDAYGAYRPDNNTIILATEETRTFFHELSHKAHEIIEGKLKIGQHPEQEAIAELSAAVLARLYGYDYDSYAWHYLTHYTEKSPEAVGRLCFSVLAKVQKVLELILTTEKDTLKCSPTIPFLGEII